MEAAVVRREADADEMHRALEGRLEALTRALQNPAPRGARADDGSSRLIEQAEAQLTVAARVADVLEHSQPGWDVVDQTVATVLLRDLASACDALRAAAIDAARLLAESHDSLRSSRTALDSIEKAAPID